MKKRVLTNLSLLIMGVMFLFSAANGGGSPAASPIETSFKNNETVQLIGTVYKREIKSENQVIYLKNNSVKSDKYLVDEQKIIVYTKPDIKVKIGQEITVSGRLSFFDAARNPGNFDTRDYYARGNIFARITADTIVISDEKYNELREWLQDLRISIKSRMYSVLGEKEGAVLSSILLGDKTDLETDIKEAYKLSGIGHILAISGLHISILGAGLYEFVRKRTGSFTIGAVAGILFLSLYAVMIGFTISVTRAYIMFLFRIGAELTGRKYDGVTALSFAAAVVILISPTGFFEGSFYLSFGAVLGIMVIGELFKSMPLKNLTGGFTVSLVLLGPMVYYFYELPTYSIAVNLIVIPLLTILLLAGVVGSVLIGLIPIAGEKCFELCSLIIRLYNYISKMTIKLPYSRVVTGSVSISVIVIYYVLLSVIILMLMSKVKRGCVRLLVLSVFYIVSIAVMSFDTDRNTLQVTFIDVGQGDAIYIKSPTGETFMVDGGSTDIKEVGRYRIEPFLKYNGIRKLDYVFISHGDYDHISGIIEMLGRQDYGIEIDNVILPVKETWDDKLYEIAEAARTVGTTVYCMEPGEAITSEELSITALYPEGNITGESNANSLVLALGYGKFDLLLTGDIEGRGEEKLTEILGDGDTSYEFLKVAHHGSKNSTSEEFLKVCGAKHTFISAGVDNRYGHPHEETYEGLRAAECTIMETPKHGAISIVTDGEAVTYKGWLDNEKLE